jgi:hypothetical protein
MIPVKGFELLHIDWLVVAANPSENMSLSVGIMKFPIYGKITHVPNHQPDYIITLTI